MISDPIDQPCIVVEGNLSDGYTFHGPFADFDDATEWCDRYGTPFGTWVSTLHSPKERTDVSGELVVYGFKDGDGTPTGYYTQDVAEAEELARRQGLRLIAYTY